MGTPGGHPSSLESRKADALIIARDHFPGADEIRLCLCGGELLAEVWKDGVCSLRHTEVYL